MIGRLLKSLICIGALTAMAAERDPAPAALDATAAIAAAAARHARAVCAADLPRCLGALEKAGVALPAAAKAAATVPAAARPKS